MDEINIRVETVIDYFMYIYNNLNMVLVFNKFLNKYFFLNKIIETFSLYMFSLLKIIYIIRFNN